MGYTHYWNLARPLTEADIAALRPDIEAAILASEIPVANAHGDPGTDPILTADKLWLNGVDDDAHETFGFAVGDTGFQFCKTAYKPYDVIVTASLLCAKDRLGSAITLSSDGDAADWAAGQTLAMRATGRLVAAYESEDM